MPGKTKARAGKKSRGGKSKKKRVSSTGKRATTKAAAAQSAQQGIAGPIEHLVVLMMENRSFDHIPPDAKLTPGRPGA
jgi:phospholipase C